MAFQLAVELKGGAPVRDPGTSEQTRKGLGLLPGKHEPLVTADQHLREVEHPVRAQCSMHWSQSLAVHH